MKKKVLHVYAVKKEKLIYTYKSETTTTKTSLPSFVSVLMNGNRAYISLTSLYK